MTNTYYYEGPNPTVDLVLVSPEKKVLLILRADKVAACPSMWAIPGGFVDSTSTKHTRWEETIESPQEAALRELAEETGISSDKLDINRLQLNGIYEGNQRDPRDNETSWSKSHSFYYLMNDNEKDIINSVKGVHDNVDLDDAQDTHWFSFEEISQMKLAFDHNKIIEDTYQKILNKKNKTHSL